MKKPAVTPLRNLRRARTLNQETFAQLLGVSQQTLSKYERGLLVPSRDMQAVMAAILGVSVDTLFPDGEPVGAKR